jgi:hypothetical protein
VTYRQWIVLELEPAAGIHDAQRKVSILNDALQTVIREGPIEKTSINQLVIIF